MNTVHQSREEAVKAIVANEFEGMAAEHNTDDILRRILAVGGLTDWHMHGFVGGQKLYETSLTPRDAQLIYWSFRITGLLKAFDALVYAEHSWGWSFHDLDLLEELISLVQERLGKDGKEDQDAWGALNIFRVFVRKSESMNVVMTGIPCTCFTCIRKNVMLAITEQSVIRATRKAIRSFLDENVSAEDVAKMYEIPE